MQRISPDFESVDVDILRSQEEQISLMENLPRYTVFCGICDLWLMHQATMGPGGCQGSNKSWTVLGESHINVLFLLGMVDVNGSWDLGTESPKRFFPHLLSLAVVRSVALIAPIIAQVPTNPPDKLCTRLFGEETTNYEHLDRSW